MTESKKPVPRLEISVTALMRDTSLGSVRAYLDETLQSATIGIAVRDPERSGKCNMRLMPGSKGRGTLFATQLDLLRRSSLVTPQTADAAHALWEKLEGLPHQSGALYPRISEVALDKLPMQSGQLFCIFDLDGMNGATPTCLARFPTDCAITPAHCAAYYRGAGRIAWPEIWEVGVVSRTNSTAAIERVDEMISRGKVSAETGRMFVEWIKETASQVERLPQLPMSRRDR